jgi:hypothetical protein
MNLSYSTRFAQSLFLVVAACSQASHTSSGEPQNVTAAEGDGGPLAVQREAGVLHIESATAVLQPVQPGTSLDIRLTANVVFENPCFVPRVEDIVRVVQTTDTGLRVDLVTVTSKNCTDEHAPVTKSIEVLHRAFARLTSDTPRVEVNGVVATVDMGG